jgi:hypothetical protein
MHMAYTHLQRSDAGKAFGTAKHDGAIVVQQPARPKLPKGSRTSAAIRNLSFLRAVIGGGGEIRTRGPRSGRRFSRPVVSTAHPPLLMNSNWRDEFSKATVTLTITIRIAAYKFPFRSMFHVQGSMLTPEPQY